MIWQRQLGQTAVLGAASAVPEPAAAGLMALAAATILIRRRHFRR
jgi:hypothetical protein